MARVPVSTLSITLRRAAAAISVGSLVALGLAVPAAADSAPADPTNPASPPTVAADALPTAQHNGVAWTQTVVGNTVYVGGRFTKARPPGAAAGTSEVDRLNLLAYDITTGQLVPNFAPQVDGQVRSITRSPDGKRIYVVGDFSRVDGQYRVRIAAFDTATNQLVADFRPTLATTGLAIAATNTTVYAGGNFESAAGVTGGTLQPRRYLAAFNATDGALTSFVADADAPVTALAVTADGSKLVVGGRFTELSGADFYGLGAVHPTTGAPLPFPANDTIRNAGVEASVTSLYADATGVYGTGYHYGDGGNLEGTFRTDPSVGNLTWVADCHGDAYSTFRSRDVVYTASHHHYCGNMGGFPQTDPWQFYYANAFSISATGVNTPDIYDYPDFPGVPAPTLLNWFPQFYVGNFSGLGQAVWTVSGNEDYVVYGGEFPGVNGGTQYGLVRFATPDKAPNKQGPRLQGSTFPLNTSSRIKGEVRMTFGTNWDRDNQALTYRIYRQSETSAPIYTETITTPFWKPQTRVVKDTGLPGGSTQRYRLTATDPFGNVTRSAWMTVTVSPDGVLSPYADAVLEDGASSFWRLSEAAGSTTAEDWAGTSTGVAGAGVTWGVDGAVEGDPDTAADFSGTSTGLVATQTAIDGPQTFTVEAWFRTTSRAGGKIVGFGNRNTGTSTSYDRHVYLDTSGRVVFGVYPGAERTIQSAAGKNDGEWHHVVATLGPDGMKLYLDGARVAQRTDTTSAQQYSGYWRIGGDRPWSGATWFDGEIDDVAIYPAPLTAAQVDAHWVAAGGESAVPAVPADAYGAAVRSLEPDLYWRLDDASGSTARDSGGMFAPGVYVGTVTRGVAGALVGLPDDDAVRFTGAAGSFLRSVDTYVNPTTYSQELWFRTETTEGGKLIGFGSSATGTSGSYDRHVYMETDGRLTFGVWTGAASTVTTAQSYNDDEWHHLVATQSVDGMRLYVDGVLTGSHPQTGAQAYTGYWRVGGDTTWGPQPWFAGAVDEVAVYPRALTPAEVAQHFQVGSGDVPNQAPVAAFTATTDDLAVAVDGAASSDPDGSVAGYAWDFGDGTTATGAQASHTYDEPGTFTVTLTVTDDDGATHSTAQDVTVQAPNQEPVAAFDVTTTDLTVAVDGASSSDPDGSVVQWSWEFGDGSAAVTGTTASHAYAAAGEYTVTLTVTDDRGGEASTSQTVTVAPPVGPVVLAADTFGRSSASTWGAADAGGSWAHAGSASLFTVGDGVGRLTLATGGSSPRARLAEVSAADVDVTVGFSLDKLSTTGATRLWLTGRQTAWTSEYLVKVNVAQSGNVSALQLMRKVGGTETVVAQVVPGATVALGTRYNLRLQVAGTGTTTLRAKMWAAGATEPDWQVQATDSTPELQGPGAVGVGAYTATSTTNLPIVVSWDDLRVTTLG